MSQAPDTPLRVIQISDTHLGAQPGLALYGVDVDRGLDAVLARIATEEPRPPDLILATGDLVHDEGETAYARLANKLAALGPPVYCLPGNHDDAAVLQRCYREGPVRWQRRILGGGWQIVLLDSALAGSPAGHLAPGELAALDAALADHPQRPALVCLHHPPVAVGTPWLDTMRVDNGEALFATLARHPQVRALTCGHVHHEFRGRRDGIELFTTPSRGRSRR